MITSSMIYSEAVWKLLWIAPMELQRKNIVSEHEITFLSATSGQSQKRFRTLQTWTLQSVEPPILVVGLHSYGCKNIVVKSTFGLLDYDVYIYNYIIYIYIWYMCYWRLRCTFLFISMYMYIFMARDRGIYGSSTFQLLLPLSSASW